MANNIYDPSLTAQHISTNLANYEAARSGFFVFVVDDLDGIVKATYKGDPAEAGDEDRILNAQEVLKLNTVKTSFVPQYSLEVLSYRRGNEIVNFAGIPTWNTGGTITIDDVVGLDTKSILMAWLQLAYNTNTRKGGRMKDYKKNCTLIEYTQDYEQIRSWTLYGCFVTEVSEGGFDKEGDGKRQLEATIQYDRAEMNLPTTEK